MIKKIVLYLMFAIFLALVVNAGIDVEIICDHKDCMEGTKMTFNVTITNNLEKDIVVGDIYVKEILGEIDYADVSLGGKLGTNKYGKVVLLNQEQTIPFSAGSTRVITVRKDVVIPTEGYTFYGIPCMRVVVYNNSKVSSYGDVCARTVESYNAVPLSEVECENDFVCSYDEKCVYYKCDKLKCNETEIALNHSCAPNNFFNRFMRFIAKILNL